MEEFKSAYPLIHNKVISPRFVTPILRRPRLLDWLNARSECRAVVIAAGAGYGKTTLLWQWEQMVDFPCYWYKLDRNDRDWTLHISYLVEAVSQRHPGFGRKAHSILRQMGGPGSSRPGVTAFLLAEMHERLKEPCTFIIDDWQFVASVTEVRGLWNQILRDAPPTCRFVFSSRGKPQLQFARFKTHGGYAELRTDELRMTEPEITELFRDVYRDPLTPDEAVQLERRTEGWAASLQLVGVTLRERKTPEKRRALIESITARSDTDLFSFLAEEVMEQQTEETRNFLLSTSILQQITPDLAERLAGVHDGTRRLLQLEHAGLFTYRLDEARYRYHGLFRDFLERRLSDERTDAEITGLHIHAASYYETSTEWPEAIYHYLRAGLQRQAARLIARYGEDVVAEGRLGLVDEWLQQLPDKAIRDNARLSLLHGEALGIRGEFESALAALERARAFFAKKGDRRMQALALVKESSLFSHWGRPDAGSEAAQKAMQFAPRGARALEVRIGGNLAINQSWPRLPLAQTQRELMRVTADAIELGLDHYAAIGFHNLGQVQLEIGDLEHALESLARSAAFWNQPGCGPFADNYNLVRCLIAVGDLARAESEARQALTATREWPRVHAEASCGIARVLMAKGEFGQAARALETHVFGRRDLGASTEMVLCHYLQAKLLAEDLDSNAVEVARRLAERQLDPRQAPDTQAVLAAVSHELGTCAKDCGKKALDAALDWRDRGATLMGSEALLMGGHVAIAHRVPGAGATVARALADVAQLNTLVAKRHWVRRLSTHVPSMYRWIGGELWPLLIRLDFQTWAPQLLSGGLDRVAGSDERALVVDAIERCAGPADLEVLASSTDPDIVAARNRLSTKYAVRLFVRSFGKLTVRRGDWEGPALGISKRRERALLGHLVAHFGESISRDSVLEALWPETTASAAFNSLNQTLFQLRRVIDPDYRDGMSPPYILTTAESIELNPDLIRVDWMELTHRLPSLLADGDSTTGARFAIRMIRGQFLSESLYDDWSVTPRQRVHRMMRGALISLTANEALGPDTRAALAECLVLLDEYDETAHIFLARALAASGRRVAALRTLRRLAARLSDEAIDPSDDLMREITELGNGSQVQ
jgi:ATP/maltotriose-dependent transcriptional regulator MalT/DNA-binding SARP family transcriptional activator